MWFVYTVVYDIEDLYEGDALMESRTFWDSTNVDILPRAAFSVGLPPPWLVDSFGFGLRLGFGGGGGWK